MPKKKKHDEQPAPLPKKSRTASQLVSEAAPKPVRSLKGISGALLAIDVGNTNVHFGLWHSGDWVISWRARTVPDKMPDEYAVLLSNFLQSSELTYAAISGVAIGSVVPRLTTTFVELVERYIHVEPLIVTHRTKTGVRVEIDQPEQAGADRIINSAAVVALYGAPAIVIDFGTATTFDIVSADGAYRGGAIAPGINVSQDALVNATAQLHKVNLQPPPCVIGTNTIHAMQSGIFLGYVAMIEGMVARFKEAMHDEHVKVIATGGLAVLFDQNTDVIDLIAPELTLEGLRVIYEMNQA
ncbi:MAG TPA: type III pantothenate kinase [Phototrophicaceae bacterium]|nr:type III pantothenate kinase [Phototrophicaceae bacterium]